MFHRFNNQLQYKLVIAFTVVLLLPALGITFYSLVNSRRNLVEVAQLERLRLAEARAAAVHTMLAEPTADLLFLTQTPEVRRYVNSYPESGAATGAEQMFQLYLQRNFNRYGRICLLNLYGQEVICAGFEHGLSTSFPPISLQNRADATYFSRAIRLTHIPGRQLVYISELELELETSTGKEIPVLYYATPLKTDKGLIMGVLVLQVLIEPIFVLVLDNTAEQKTYLVDNNGQYLYHPDPARRYSNLRQTGYSLTTDLPHDSQIILTQSSGTLYQTDDRPDDMQVFTRILPPEQQLMQWTLIYEQPMESLLTSVRKAQWVNVGIIIASFCAGILLALILARNIVQPILELSQAASSISQGNLHTPLPVIHNQDEIGTLGEAFARMSQQLNGMISQLEQQVIELQTARQTLRQSEIRLHSVVQNISDIVAIWDLDKGIHYLSPTVEKVLGYDRGELWRGIQFNLIHPDDQPRVWSVYQQALNQETMPVIECRTRHADGHWVWFEVSTSNLLYDPDVHGIVSVARDITWRKQTEIALRESEDKFRSFVEQSYDGIRLIGSNGRILVWNEAMARISGIPGEVARGKFLWDVIFELTPDEYKTEATYENVKNSTLTAVKTGDLPFVQLPAIYELQRSDGTRRLVQSSLFPIKTDQGMMIGAILRDMTAQRGYEETIRLLTRAVEQIPVSVIITDTNGKIQYVNPKFTEITGYTAVEAQGQTSRLVKSGEHPPEFYHQLWATLKAGREWQGIFQNRRKSGELFWEAGYISPVRNEAGNITHYVAIKEDITERRLLEEQIRQQERLAAVGHLAAGIAHDFNNILSAIIMNLDILQMRGDLPATAYPHLDRVRQQGERAAQLIRQILDFSRKSVREPELVNLSLFVKEFMQFLDRTIPEHITIRFEMTSQPYLIYADLTQLQQVITNLVVNARDAMPEGGQLTVRVTSLQLTPKDVLPVPLLQVGYWVVLQVIDTGLGIPEAVLPRIFDPFFTTKQPGMGTGLGLAQVYGIVQQHGGVIDVQSSLGQGATFTIYFPAVPSHERESLERPSPQVMGQGETILLVEDDAAAMEVTKQGLTTLNYQVITAVNGVEALTCYQIYQAEIDLILTDVVMPQLDGVGLLQTLQQQGATIPIVLMSGYPLQEQITPDVQKQATSYLSKPINLKDLSHLLHQILYRRNRHLGGC